MSIKTIRFTDEEKQMLKAFTACPVKVSDYYGGHTDVEGRSLWIEEQGGKRVIDHLTASEYSAKAEKEVKQAMRSLMSAYKRLYFLMLESLKNHKDGNGAWERETLKHRPDGYKWETLLVQTAIVLKDWKVYSVAVKEYRLAEKVRKNHGDDLLCFKASALTALVKGCHFNNFATDGMSYQEIFELLENMLLPAVGSLATHDTEIYICYSGKFRSIERAKQLAERKKAAELTAIEKAAERKKAERKQAVINRHFNSILRGI